MLVVKLPQEGRRDTYVLGQPVLLLALAALAWTSIQAFPLPCFISQFFAPEAALQTRNAHKLLGHTAPFLCSLSLDTTQTLIQVVNAIALVMTGLSAICLCQQKQEQMLLRAVGLSCVAMGLAMAIHLYPGVTQLWGFYEPIYSRSPLIAPLVNPNQLGGFLGMGVPILLGLGYTRIQNSSKVSLVTRLVTIGLAMALTSGAILTRSRGSLIVLGAGIGTWVFLVLKKRRLGWTGKLWRFLGVIGVVALAGFMASGSLSEEFYLGTPENPVDPWLKLRIAAKSVKALALQPWVGVGRGAFSQAFTRIYGVRERYEYPENLIAQWITEWGILFGTAALIAGALMILFAARHKLRSYHIAALSAIVAIVAHDMVDFSLETTGIAVTVMVLAVLATSPLGTLVPYRISNAALIKVGGASLLATALLVPRILNRDTESYVQSAQALIKNNHSQELASVLRHAVQDHPSDPTFTLLETSRRVIENDKLALRWANQTMQLAPYWGAPHALAAQWMIRRGYVRQAMYEIRKAFVLDANTVAPYWCEWIQTRSKETDKLLDWIETAAPVQGADPKNFRIDFLDRSAICLGATPAVGDAVDAMLLETDADNANAHLRIASHLLQQQDIQNAIVHIRAVINKHPENIRAHTLLAQSYMALDKPDMARQVIADTEKKYGADVDLLEIKVQLYLKQQNEVGLRKTMMQIKELHATSAKQMTDDLVRLAGYELQLGNRTRAFGILEEASKLEPRVSVLLDLGRLAEELGDLSRARAIYSDLTILDPSNQQAQQALNRLGEPSLPKAAAVQLDQDALDTY